MSAADPQAAVSSGPQEFLLPAQRQLVEQVTLALEEIAAGGNSVGILVSGPSGSGKTTAMDALARPYVPYVDGYQRCIPCCRVSAASMGDAASLMRSILRQLGKPSAIRNGNLEEQLFDAIRACQVKLLIVEELSNALLTEGRHLRFRTARLLKNLWNPAPDDAQSWVQPQRDRGDWRLVIVVSGTEELEPVFNHEGELSSRYSCRIHLRRLWFDRETALDEFGHVLSSMVARHQLLDFIDVEDLDMISRCLFACEGHLRCLNTLLQRTATLRKRSSGLDARAVLGKAFDAVLRTNTHHDNPFGWSFEDLKHKVVLARQSHRD